MNDTVAMIIECPQCGATVKTDCNVCEYCNSEYLIKSLDSLSSFDKRGIDKYITNYKKAAANDPSNSEINAAIAICYLKLGLFNFAAKFFEKAIEDMMENSDLYFYLAICVFKGKRPFLIPLTLIKKAEEFLEAAIALSPDSGKYYYAHSLIKYDYYYKKRLNTCPNFQELLDDAEHYQISHSDKQMVEDLLKISF